MYNSVSDRNRTVIGMARENGKEDLKRMAQLISLKKKKNQIIDNVSSFG